MEYFSEAKVKFFIIRKSVEITQGLLPIKKIKKIISNNNTSAKNKVM